MAVDQFCLKWNNFQSSLISAFESLQTTEDLADVTLTTEGINVKAHKIILSACSPYFRNVFKENPCSHPIVILKDVFYDDLLAILKFMYHGEVLVAKDRLHSFLQTGEVLQVSGLIGCTDFSIKTTTPKTTKLGKTKESDGHQPISKKSKFLHKPPKKSDYSSRNVDPPPINNIEAVCTDKIKMETDDFHVQSDVNENLGCFPNLGEKPVSILETVLETKDNPSILERSLMSNLNTGNNPAINYTDHHHQTSSELVKHLVVTQKVAEGNESENRLTKQKLPIDYPTVTEQQLNNQTIIKTEEENVEVTIDLPNVVGDIGIVNVRPIPDIQPHHSSQCGNCPHCGKIYSNQSALKYHVRLVHSDLLNLYCCHLCPEVFDYREGYKKHMVEVHSLRN
ncbi:btb domain transcription factor [Holotrichia oblita]|uniref:Btb domain transcription factor n=1 Tax=Holotrichia oblita TaxID=644536 RepID=A0ACB9TEP5_HOLOL|nr:btb domain transcription factor [Holotrichia oblita]